MPLSKPTVSAAITPMTTPVPQRSDRTNFAARGDVFLSEMPPTVTGINTNVTYIDAAVQYIEQEANAADASAVAAAGSSVTAAASAASATGATNVNGTSTTVRTPSVASLTWTYVETARVPAVGMRLRAASRANPTTNFAAGTVTAWDGTSIVTINVDVIGTVPVSASDWNIILEGQRGEAGLTETTFVDKGTVASGTVTFTIGASDRMQRVQASGNITLAVSGWAVSGRLSELLIEAANFGGNTITWPTVNWIKADGTTTTTLASNGVTWQTTGTDFVLLWTRDGGTTVYGKVMR